MKNTYDVVIIGAGPGGYNCAIKAGQLGLRVACIEKNPTLGGTCLNVGCIPSKSLLHSSELYAAAARDFAHHGIKVKGLSLDLDQMMKAKDEAVDGLTQGVAFLLKKNKVDVFHGTGEIKSATSVAVTDKTGKVQTLDTKNVVIATGSTSASLPGIAIDEDIIVSSTGALKFDKVPDRLVVVGGGVIGLELGSVWSRLGSNVTVLEYSKNIIPGADAEVANSARKIFEKQGISFRTACEVQNVTVKNGSAKIGFKDHSSNAFEELDADRVIIAVGRKPYTEGLSLDAAKIKTDKGGRVVTQTPLSVSDTVWVIGDCTHGTMLAHKAEEEGIAVAEQIAGHQTCVDNELIPNVVYTNPEIAWVGQTEEELKSAGRDYCVGNFPLAANSRSRANHQTDGFVKVLADKKSDLILGIHIIGPGASELIGEACVCMAMSGSSEDIASICHAHPTVSEALRQAAMATTGLAMQK